MAKNPLDNLRPAWKKGETGNKRGRSSSYYEMQREVAKLWPRAIEIWKEALESPDIERRDAARDLVIAYNLGKPNQPITVDAEVTPDELFQRLVEVAAGDGEDVDAGPTGSTH